MFRRVLIGVIVVAMMSVAGADYATKSRLLDGGAPMGFGDYVGSWADVVAGRPVRDASDATGMAQATGLFAAMLQIVSPSGTGQAGGKTAGDTPSQDALTAAVAAGDLGAVSQATEGGFNKVAAALDAQSDAAHQKPARAAPKARKGAITIGTGNCGKRAGGKFCSVGN